MRKFSVVDSFLLTYFWHCSKGIQWREKLKVPLSLIFLLRKSLQISALTCRKQKFFQSRARLLSYEA